MKQKGFKNFVLSFQKSQKYIVETHKPLIPTIIYYDGDAVKTFKFMFWRWWFKILYYRRIRGQK
jgi:hypothetical protein